MTSNDTVFCRFESGIQSPDWGGRRSLASGGSLQGCLTRISGLRYRRQQPKHPGRRREDGVSV
ncbi:hypothetical protein [Mycobacterium uberis]|uniref:hypothetical protein n=1 Tax=Mycobacterium uberis TaxID=2162698 RepID=UPI001403B27C|nr:hypothetical protein [Mycobacterium uberis]